MSRARTAARAVARAAWHAAMFAIVAGWLVVIPVALLRL